MYDWIPLEALAIRLQLSESWLRSQADDGSIPHLRLPGGRRRFNQEQVEDALRNLADKNTTH